MRKGKKNRTTPLVFPDGLTHEQLETLQEKRFLFDIIVPLNQRPKLAHLIRCFTCQQTTTFEVGGRKRLTQDELHLKLILKGWTSASRGYECPDCIEQWAKGVAAFITGESPRVDARNRRASELDGEEECHNAR